MRSAGTWGEGNVPGWGGGGVRSAEAHSIGEVNEGPWYAGVETLPGVDGLDGRGGGRE